MSSQRVKETQQIQQAQGKLRAQYSLIRNFTVVGVEISDPSETLCIGCAAITNCEHCDHCLASDSCTHKTNIFDSAGDAIDCDSCGEKF